MQTETLSIKNFAKTVHNWLINDADEDDVKNVAAEFFGVPVEQVSVKNEMITVEIEDD